MCICINTVHPKCKINNILLASNCYQHPQANLYHILLNGPLLHMHCTNWKTVVFLTVLLLQCIVQASSERRHLHLLVQPFLHERLVSSWQLDAMGGSLVQHTFHIFLFPSLKERIRVNMASSISNTSFQNWNCGLTSLQGPVVGFLVRLCSSLGTPSSSNCVDGML